MLLRHRCPALRPLRLADAENLRHHSACRSERHLSLSRPKYRAAKTSPCAVPGPVVSACIALRGYRRLPRSHWCACSPRPDVFRALFASRSATKTTWCGRETGSTWHHLSRQQEFSRANRSDLSLQSACSPRRGLARIRHQSRRRHAGRPLLTCIGKSKGAPRGDGARDGATIDPAFNVLCRHCRQRAFQVSAPKE
jgi:hypothetical protein